MKVVVVGAVAGGATFATSLRRLSEEAEIIMFEKDRDMSYKNCEIPYYLSYEIRDYNQLIARTPEDYKVNYNIEAKNFHEVIDINRDDKYVIVKDLKNGKTFNETYDYLVLSPGSKVNIPEDIKGTDKKHVFSVQNVVDVESIRKFYEDNNVKDIFVGGGGFIGIESAENLNKLPDVNLTLLIWDYPLSVIDMELKGFIEDNIKENGVNIIKKEDMVEITDTEVVFKSGKRVKADMVILSLGMKPLNDLGKKADLPINEKTGSIEVDNNYQTEDPSIYAIGDVVDVTNLLSEKKQKLALAWPAHRQAKYVANHIMGNAKRLLSYIGTFALRSFDMNIAVTGLQEKQLIDMKAEYEATVIAHTDKVSIMPDAKMVYMKLLFNKNTGKIYGAQAVGPGVVDKRIDVIAALIKMDATVYDLDEAELAYQPLYSTTEDLSNIIANQAINIMDKRLPQVRLSEFNDVKDEYEIYDLRNETAYEAGHIRGAKLFDGRNLRANHDWIDKDKKIIFYDETGGQSTNMIKMLRNFGYDNIYMLEGSMLFFRKYNEIMELNLIEEGKWEGN